LPATKIFHQKEKKIMPEQKNIPIFVAEIVINEDENTFNNTGFR